MANYPQYQVQNDLLETMESKSQEWFRDCVLFDMYLQNMVDKPKSPVMGEAKFNKMLFDQSMMPSSWIEHKMDNSLSYSLWGRDYVMYKIRGRSCFGDNCEFSSLYQKAKKILSWKKDHNYQG